MTATSPEVCIHFAHANGFPAKSYQTMFDYLPDHWRQLSVDKFGHSARWPVNKNWSNQVDELIANVKAQRPDGEVYAVGHSFGAVVSYMAACKAPELFKGLIMFDPPLVTGPFRHLVRLAKKTPLIDKLTPSGLSKNRCTHWPAGTDLTAYFAGKGLFKQMDRRCIADYVKAVATPTDTGWTLGFDASVETAIFRNVPHNLSRFSGTLSCPAILVTGSHTTVCTPVMRNRFIRHNKLEHTQLNGGHMFPLEHPRETAAFIERQIAAWEQRA